MGATPDELLQNIHIRVKWTDESYFEQKGKVKLIWPSPSVLQLWWVLW